MINLIIKFVYKKKKKTCIIVIVRDPNIPRVTRSHRKYHRIDSSTSINVKSRKVICGNDENRKDFPLFFSIISTNIELVVGVVSSKKGERPSNLWISQDEGVIIPLLTIIYLGKKDMIY